MENTLCYSTQPEDEHTSQMPWLAFQGDDFENNKQFGYLLRDLLQRLHLSEI